jgi:hypothetical protein
MTIKIRRVETNADRGAFVRTPWLIYKDDPRWVPPLIMDRLEAINPKKNPFFEYSEVVLFLAEKNGEVVGRISAQVNRRHNEYHKDKTGFFGFFECIDDEAACFGLLDAASGWLKDQGCDKAIGPESFSTNEELGVLVQGFDEPIQILCPYNPPYYGKLIEAAGYEKEKDLFGWIYKAGEIPEAPLEIAKAVSQIEGLVIRQMNIKQISSEIRIVSDIFNASWNKNWGFVPWSDSEVKHAAKMLKMIIIPELTAIAEYNGKPIGMMIALPNIMEIQKDLNGRLFPFGLLKLIYRLKLGGHRFKTARLTHLGILPEYRSSILGGLSVLLYITAHRNAKKLGIEGGELGWTLEENDKINKGIEFMGGRVGKIYRIYGKSL